MLDHARCGLAFILAAGLAWAGPAAAQTHHHHAAPPDSSAAKPDSSMHDHDMPGMNHDMPGMDHDMSAMGHDHDMSAMGGEMAMNGLYGPYPMSREASGTAWQPDRAGHHGIHEMRGSWMLMLHGMADVVYDYQGGPRGDEKLFSSNMLMGMAQRPVGPGTFGLRAMVSLEPSTIGKEGYPLLLQTGETANGRTHLIDRQHPHDLFMELAATYSIASGNRSLFVYGGLPGEPALGPPAFMHRFSGLNMPQAPITHHWLDSSHITFGVLTAGVVWGGAKVEASAFRGREPDQNRYDIETPKLDSHSFRLSLNPTPAWAFQVSHGRLKSPEQLGSDVDVDRTTASAMFAREWTDGRWEATVAWGRNRSRPGPTLEAFAGEAAVRLREKHTLFARAERVEKNELFPEDDPRDGDTFNVGELSAGYRFDFWKSGRVTTGLGVLGTLSFVPGEIQDAYGDNPTSGMVFAHVELR
jgi:hypothetical protein